MGYNDEYTRQSPITCDIETSPHPLASTFIDTLDLDAIPVPDLAAIQPAGNLKDPLKIAESIVTRRLAAQMEYEARIASATAAYHDKLGRAGLDFNLSRIVSICWTLDDDVMHGGVCRDEAAEAAMLILFWAAQRGRLVCGFSARTFDMPTLIQRSRLLSIAHPSISLARFGKGAVLDLREWLTFDDARYEAIMPRSLHAFCRRFGLAVEDDSKGSQVAAMVAAEDWDGIWRHNTSDVRLTVALGRRLGVLQPATAGVF